MKIENAYPPNYSAITERFPAVPHTNVIFSYGGVLYNPHKIDVSPSLLAHEIAHGKRQLAQGITSWWDQYLVDDAFRLAEELHGHLAEYAYLISNGNRQERRRAMNTVSNKLASPIYGPMITVAKARKKLINLYELGEKAANRGRGDVY